MYPIPKHSKCTQYESTLYQALTLLRQPVMSFIIKIACKLYSVNF